MIHKEPLASYLKRRVFLGALGLSEGEPVVFSLLGQGEYNVNYSFIHPRTGKKLVLRINTGSQMHLEDQIGYEFTALQYLVPSGRTPKPLFCDREQGLLVMEWLPGRTLDYKTDMDEAAGILADIHSVPVPEGCRLIRPSCPAQAIYEECLDMVQHYYDWEKRDPEVEALLRQLVKETGNLPLTEKAGEGVPLCMVNTELNSGNFLIDPQGVSSLVDWEKPLVSEPAQDLGHFLANKRLHRHFQLCQESVLFFLQVLSSLFPPIDFESSYSTCPIRNHIQNQFLAILFSAHNLDNHRLLYFPVRILLHLFL